jgi:hypothetical protein
LIYKSWKLVQNTSYIRMGTLPAGSLPNGQFAKHGYNAVLGYVMC